MHGFFKWSTKWWPGVIPLVIATLEVLDIGGRPALLI